MQMDKLCQVSVKVDENMLASSFSKGEVDVLATPAMIALMEKAAMLCMEEMVGPEETTVSAQVEVQHISAVPLGEDITATAELIKQTGKKVMFKVFCEDRTGIIGKGTHVRLIVNRDRFQGRADAKRLATVGAL